KAPRPAACRLLPPAPKGLEKRKLLAREDRGRGSGRKPAARDGAAPPGRRDGRSGAARLVRKGLQVPPRLLDVLRRRVSPGRQLEQGYQVLQPDRGGEERQGRLLRGLFVGHGGRLPQSRSSGRRSPRSASRNTSKASMPTRSSVPTKPAKSKIMASPVLLP